MKTKIFLSFLLIPLSYIFYKHLVLGFWNDEVYSLQYFVLVPISTSVLDYHIPNNHILFSLLNNLYLKLIGIQDLKTVLENPFIVRLPLAIIPIIILVLYYKVSKLLFNNKSEWQLGTILLATNLVFANFSLQYRAYGLSTLLLLFIFLQILKLSSNGINQNVRYFYIAVAGALAFYAIPSNLYFLLVLGFYPLFKNIVEVREFRSFYKSRAFKITLAVTAGLCIGFGLYSPIINEVFFNEYVSSTKPFEFTNFDRMVNVVYQLSSFHLILVLVGLVILFKNIKKPHIFIHSKFGFVFSFIVIPFIFSFLHGDIPPYRVYSVVLPFFTLMLTKALLFVVNYLKINKFKYWPYYVGIYLLLFYASTETFSQIKSDNSLKNNHRNQNLLYQYYNYNFYPNKSISSYLSSSYSNLPLFLVDQELQGFPIYLNSRDINFTIIENSVLEKIILENDSIVLVSPFPAFIDELKGQYSKFYITGEKLCYHNFILLSKHTNKE